MNCYINIEILNIKTIIIIRKTQSTTILNLKLLSVRNVRYLFFEIRNMTAKSAFVLVWLFNNSNSKSTSRMLVWLVNPIFGFFFIRCVLFSVRVININRDIEIIARYLFNINKRNANIAYSILQKNVCVLLFSAKKLFLRFSCCLVREFQVENYFFQSFFVLFRPFASSIFS